MDEHMVELIKTSFSKIFNDFGLNQARAYATLLGRGSMSAFEISKESGVPRGRIYDTLTELERKKLIESQESNPKQFFITEARESIENAFQEKQKTLLSVKKELIDHASMKEKNQEHEVNDIFKLTKVSSIKQIQECMLNLVDRSERNELILVAGGKGAKYFSNVKAQETFLNALSRNNTVKVMAKIDILLPDLYKNSLKLKRITEFLHYLNKHQVEFKNKGLLVDLMLRSKKEVAMGIRNLGKEENFDFLIHVTAPSGKTCKLAEKIENTFFEIWDNEKLIMENEFIKSINKKSKKE